MKTWACSCVVILAIWGCSGGESFDRVDLTGTVNYAGEPVAHGKVVFSPAAENRGPNTIAYLNEGQFKTAPEMGPGTGAYQVTVSILKKNPEAEPDSDQEFMSIGTYEELVTITKEQAEIAIDIAAGDLTLEE